MRFPFSVRLAFVLTVVAEIAVFVLAVRTLGGWATFWLLLATALLGGWVVRNEGIRAWTRLNEALQAGRMPAAEGAPSQAAIAGGFLLILPGFLTDLLGLLLVIPQTRGWFQGRFSGLLPPPPDRRRTSTSDGGPIIHGEVIEGEVVDPPDDGDADSRDR
jgi:UPF0716 protein FxsA